MNMTKIAGGGGLPAVGHGESDRAAPSEGTGAFFALMEEQDVINRGARSAGPVGDAREMGESPASPPASEDAKLSQEDKPALYGFLPMLSGLRAIVRQADGDAIPSGSEDGAIASLARKASARDGSRDIAAHQLVGALASPADGGVGQVIEEISSPAVPRHDPSPNLDQLDRTEESFSRLMADSGVQISVVDFETHFPAALASALPQRGLELDPTPKLDPSPASIFREESNKLPGLLKVLSIRLEPESLGQIDVRMRLGRSHLDIQITPTSPDTLVLLDRSRDELLRVIGGAGFESQNVVIQIHSVSSSAFNDANAGGGGANQNASSFEFSGDREPRNGETSRHDARAEAPVAANSRSERDVRGPHRSDGVYL